MHHFWTIVFPTERKQHYIILTAPQQSPVWKWFENRKLQANVQRLRGKWAGFSSEADKDILGFPRSYKQCVQTEPGCENDPTEQSASNTFNFHYSQMKVEEALCLHHSSFRKSDSVTNQSHKDKNQQRNDGLDSGPVDWIQAPVDWIQAPVGA